LSHVIQVVNIAFEVMNWLVIARCFLSFIRHNPYQPLIRFVYEITEPIMGPFRRWVPSTGGIDFSPIILLLALSVVRKLVISLLWAIS
jgi:YggT family protein